MELVLPNNYVAIDEEEVMYLDGEFSIPRLSVAVAINIAFNGVLGRGAISLVKNYVRKLGLRWVTSAVARATARYVGVRVANRVAGFATSATSAINGFAA